MVNDIELRRLAEAATPGPWDCTVHIGDGEERVTVIGLTEPGHGHDANYIAAVSPDVILALLDRLDALTNGRPG